jgi:hypothetical protein
MEKVTHENLQEMLTKRSIKDILVTANHPVEKMNEQGFTFLDYCLYVMAYKKKQVKHLPLWINKVLNGEPVPFDR